MLTATHTPEQQHESRKKRTVWVTILEMRLPISITDGLIIIV